MLKRQGWMSSVAGIQLIVWCSRTVPGEPSAAPEVRTTVAQVCVYFGTFGVDCAP